MNPNRKQKIFFSAKNLAFYSEDFHGYTTKLVDDPKWTRPLMEIRNPEYDPADPRWQKVQHVADESATAPLVDNPRHDPKNETEHPAKIPDPDWQRPTKEVPNPDYDEAAHIAVQTIEVPDQAAKPPKIEVPSTDHGIPADAKEVSAELHQSIQQQLAAEDAELSADDNSLPIVTIRLTLEEAKRRKRVEINRAADQSLAAILGKYPKAEVDSWWIQVEEARAWQVDNATATPLVDALVAARKVDKKVLVTKILANSAAYKAASGAVFGKRQALDDAVDRAAAVAEVKAIDASVITG